MFKHFVGSWFDLFEIYSVYFNDQGLTVVRQAVFRVEINFSIFWQICILQSSADLDHAENMIDVINVVQS